MSPHPAIDLLASTWLTVLGQELITSLLLAIAIWAVLRLLRPRSARLHHAAWALVLARLALPLEWASPASLRSALGLARTQLGELVAGSWLGSRLASLLDTPLGDGAIGRGIEQINLVVLAGLGPATGDPHGTAGLLRVALVTAWCLGAGLVMLGLASRLASYRQVVGRATPLTTGPAAALVEHWRRRLGIRRQVRLVTSPSFLSPFTVGLFRPVVLLPETVAAWPRAMLEPIIAHEMAHVRRLDELWIVLANLLRAIHFFNPVAWVAVSRLSRAREQLCDEAVLVQGCISPREYGRSLVEILRLNVGGAVAGDGLACLVGRKEGLEMRLRRILDGVGRDRRTDPAAEGRPRAAAVLLGIATMAAFILPMASVEGTAADPAGAPGPAIMTAAAGAPSAEGSGLSAALTEDATEQGMDGAATGSPATAVPASAEAGGSDDRDIPRYKDDGPITAPKQLEAAPPVYPEEARTERIQGAVVLETVIEADGTVSEVTPLRYPDPALRDAAVEAIHKWRFEPATLEGEPVAVRYVLTVMFRLE